jgi:hypothetical protein
LSVWTDGSTIGRVQVHLHCAWRPQSSGKVEWANGLLKHYLTKQAQEIHLPWPKLLPMALLCLRNTLDKLGISHFESLYSCPFLTHDLILDGETARLTSHITQLAKFQQILTELHQGISHSPSSPPPFCPSDLMLVKIPHISRESSSSYWRSHTLCCFPPQQESQVARLQSWIHISRIKHWNPSKDSSPLQLLFRNPPQDK